jgi:hypothetical protein
MCCICLDVLYVLGSTVCATCACKCCMYLDVLYEIHVPGCVVYATLPGYVICAWMRYMCQDVLYVLERVACA